MMGRLQSISLWLSRALVSLLAIGAAGSRAADLVVYVPDGPQDASQMVAAFAPLQVKARESSLALSGHYFVQLADFQKFIESKRPGFGVVDPFYFLENKDALALKPLAIGTSDSGASGREYCLVVPATKPWTRLDELAGKKLAQTPLANRYAYFTSDVLMEGMLGAASFTPKVVPHTASALRAVELEEADAAFVPCPQVGKSPKLKVLVRTRPIPYPVAIAFGGTPDADAQRFQALLTGLDGASPFCKTLGVRKFVAAPVDYARTLAAYRENTELSFDDLRVSQSQTTNGNVVPSGLLTADDLDKLRLRLVPVEQP